MKTHHIPTHFITWWGYSYTQNIFSAQQVLTDFTESIDYIILLYLCYCNVSKFVIDLQLSLMATVAANQTSSQLLTASFFSLNNVLLVK